MNGVWIVYQWDVGPEFMAAWPTELEACRQSARDGYSHVVFVEWGEDLRTAIEHDEARRA